MNQKFVNYLKLLESRAPASKKADFRHALELYKARFEAELPLYEKNFGNIGKTAEQNTFGNVGTDHKNAKRDPETVKADEKRAEEIRKSEEKFPDAAKTVTKAAETEPGKIDAWVDYRLKPVIARAKKADGLGGEEGSKAKYKSDYKAAKDKYKAEDKEAREREKAEREDALAKSREEVKRKEDEANKAASQKKLDELGKNREYKYDASMPLNATDEDINHRIAGARSEDMAKGEEADAKYRAAEKGWEDSGETYEPGTAMSDEDIAKDQAAKKKAADDAAAAADSAFSDAEKWWSDNGENWGMADVAAVNIKGLRAAFESVYGDSSEFSDREIRTICESCYRRSRKK